MAIANTLKNRDTLRVRGLGKTLTFRMRCSESSAQTISGSSGSDERFTPRCSTRPCQWAPRL